MKRSHNDSVFSTHFWSDHKVYQLQSLYYLYGLERRIQTDGQQ